MGNGWRNEGEKGGEKERRRNEEKGGWRWGGAEIRTGQEEGGIWRRWERKVVWGWNDKGESGRGICTENVEGRTGSFSKEVMAKWMETWRRDEWQGGRG